MNLVKKRFMACTIHEAYQKYIAKCTTERKVAEKTFAALRPKEVKTVQDTPLRLCWCEYCANFNKTRETLIGMGLKGIPRNHSACIEKTLCKFRTEECNEDNIRNPCVHNEFPPKKCVQRICPKCGVQNYQEAIFSTNIVKIRQLTNVMWQQWEKVPYVVNGKKKTKTCLVMHHGSMATLLALFFKQLKEIAMHQFQKLWQLRNFNFMLRHLQKGQVLFVHDFQMNFMLFVPDEPSGVHWDHPQLTVHPTSIFYKCLNEDCNEVVSEDVLHITDDKTHDKHAVNSFITKSLQHLKAKGIPIHEIIEFIDNCSAQYKSRFMFHTITKFNIPYTRHYYGVKHGKGPSDQAGGRFKKFLRDVMKAKHILLSAQQIEAYCRDAYCMQRMCNRQNNKLCNEANNKVDLQEKKQKKQKSPEHIQRIVFNHPIINRTPDEKLRGISGSRDYMHVVHNTGVTGVVQYRMFDCSCYGCVTHNEECSQQEYADEWKTACVKGKLKDKAFNVETWFKGIGK